MFKTPSNTTTVIKQALEASLNNKSTFPEHVKTIASVGVTCYAVDLLNHNVKYQLADGSFHIENLPSLTAPSNSHFFVTSEVKAAIADIQKQVIDYPTFLHRIISAGTKGYEVNIQEGKVTYQGESENHVEEFPKFTKS